MSSTLDRLRRLHGVRTKSKRAEPEIPKTSSSAHRDVNSDPVYVDFVEPAASPSARPTSESVLAGYAFDYTAALEEVVPGQEITNESGVCYLVTRAYPLSALRGPNPLQNLLSERPKIFASLFPKFNLDTVTNFHQAAFIDTETTGLGIGAGVYCFMIGVGTFEQISTQAARDISQLSPIANFDDPPTHFVVRQFFMRSPDEEAALLVAVADALCRCTMTVTFNGRTFDLPMLRARYRQNRYALPPAYEESPLLAESQPHLDLLLPARRLWKRRLGSCRLINLEDKILGQTRAEADVPGHLIPLLYSEYARGGEAGAMPGVFYHNCEDIVSMVGLAERLCRAFAADANDDANKDANDVAVVVNLNGLQKTSPSTASRNTAAQPQKVNDLHGHEWLCLGDSYERVGDLAQAEVAFQRAIYLLSLDKSGDHAVHRADAFRRVGRLQKRQERWPEAVETWQLWLGSVPGVDPTPYIELAKYFEWRSRDLDQAEMWTSWALHNLQSASSRSTFRSQIPDIEHRLIRIQRKKTAQVSVDKTQRDAEK